MLCPSNLTASIVSTTFSLYLRISVVFWFLAFSASSLISLVKTNWLSCDTSTPEPSALTKTLGALNLGSSLTKVTLPKLLESRLTSSITSASAESSSLFM